jgi:transcriptional regulator with XRE-family HTH domain
MKLRSFAGLMRQQLASRMGISYKYLRSIEQTHPERALLHLTIMPRSVVLKAL